MAKTVAEINSKIEKGNVRVVRADEMTRIVRQVGAERAAAEVDVVTTGTFGAMCSSGVFLNFGHSDPPIKMTRVWLNDVEVYGGIAAVDGYLGATAASCTLGIDYGGAHVIEDLLRGKPVVLRAVSYGTGCYPRKRIVTEVRLPDLNFARLCNPRNAYQRYNAAANSGSRAIHTYMGKLLPRLGNVTFSGAGELSPLVNDPQYRTIGLGTRIFLGGAPGYVVGHGTQHNPASGFGTLMVQGEMKEMSAEFLRAATIPGYGPTLYVGLGIPIPVLDAEIARNTGIGDDELYTDVLDYGVPRRKRPVLGRVSYAELKSGSITVNGRQVKSSPLSSYAMARNIAETLKTWIRNGRFMLTGPVSDLPRTADVRPLEIRPANAGFLAPLPPPLQPGSMFSWDEQRCLHCGLCLGICHQGVFARDADWHIAVDGCHCTACGLCSDICPVKAIAVRKKKGKK